MSYLKKKSVWIPIFLIALFSPWASFFDLAVTQYAYNTNHFQPDSLFTFIYDWGRLPAVLVFLFALIALMLSYLTVAFKKWRPAALALTIVMILGPGLIINALLKDHWGRPRPKQTIEFGGTQHFRPYYSPNFSNPEPSKSFPCGHCSMGFYFFSLALVGRRYQMRWLFWLGITSAVVLGGALSIARIGQGGHYLSDVLMSALIMWFTALSVDLFIFAASEKQHIKVRGR